MHSGLAGKNTTADKGGGSGGRGGDGVGSMEGQWK